MMAGGTHKPLPLFKAFSAAFFVVGWNTEVCDTLIEIALLVISCCLQTLKKSKSSVKEWTQGMQKRIMDAYQ
jgi:hypothetical protein